MGISIKYTQEQITEGLMALIAHAGNRRAASAYLSEEKGITIPPRTLSNWKHQHAIEYLELREKFADQQEKQLAHEYLDLAAQAAVGTKLAVEKAVEKLEANKDQDPARTAANLAHVSQSSVDRNRVLTDRPSRITETRGIDEILRGLMARVPGLIQLPEETEGP